MFAGQVDGPEALWFQQSFRGFRSLVLLTGFPGAWCEGSVVTDNGL